jgi:hypothetical protein
MNISAEVSGNTLTLKDENTCNFIRNQTKKISIYITVPHINYIRHNGVGTINYVNQFTEDSLWIDCESSGDVHADIHANYFRTSSVGDGDIYVSGYSYQSYHFQRGTNILEMRNCQVNNFMFIETLSVCDSHVNAPTNGELSTKIWDIGNVYYSGQLSVPAQVVRLGKGNLIPQE